MNVDKALERRRYWFPQSWKFLIFEIPRALESYEIVIRCWKVMEVYIANVNSGYARYGVSESSILHWATFRSQVFFFSLWRCLYISMNLLYIWMGNNLQQTLWNPLKNTYALIMSYCKMEMSWKFIGQEGADLFWSVSVWSFLFKKY